MSQRTRLLLAVIVILLIVGGVLTLDAIRRKTSAGPSTVNGTALPSGAIPIYLNGKLIAGFTPDDLGQLTEVSFTDHEEGKEQQGWLLSDLLLLHLSSDQLTPETAITVSSSSRHKSVTLTWAEVEDKENMVMFDLAGRGTLKLVSRGIERLNVRDEWIQDTDKIEIKTP